MNRNEFFKAVFKDCQGLVELRAIPAVKPIFTLHSKEINAFCEKYKDRNLYFGVATRDGKGGAKENCLYIPGFWADVDFKDTPKAELSKILNSAPVKPSIIVSSGNGVHLYFLFKKPLGASEDLEKYLRALCKHFKGDMASTDITRILRVPETRNHKYEGGAKVEVVHVTDNRYALEDFERFLDKGAGERTRSLSRRYSKGFPRASETPR